MDDLVQWPRAQLDEDERTAQATLWDDDGALGSGGWFAYDRGPREGFREARWVVIDRADEGVVDSRPQAADDQAVARHIAEWDPARVLREIDAKRMTIALCAPPLVDVTGPGDTERSYVPGEGPPWGLDVLKLLALPYADRLGYRDEWRP
ncbi:DUF6221 family protein [Streptomyces rochei]|uniref:DUF6221 family protein n=1 Tax=Streptomyces rochei TaxID=1928 RepID=UPI003793817F